MEPGISPGSSDVYQGMSDGRQLHQFGLYGGLAPPEYGSAAAGAGEMSSFMSSFYTLEMAGTGAEEEQLDRALAASRNHREAEKRRRERIKFHLDRLRTILACDAKIEKASLLAKAVEHVRDLKQRAAEIGEMGDFPTETDEISVNTGDLPTATGRRPVIKASLCCEDRSELLPELAETLRSLHLRILRAEMATVGGRVRNVLVVAGDDGGAEDEEAKVSGGSAGRGQAAFLRDALRALVERQSPGGLERQKRRRVLSTSAATA
uniref:Putative transcription factor bHLH107 n=1 Tax=Anthurium amnicola TaxID=1678845 RepID=A0A1D1YUW5_9ARAE